MLDNWLLLGANRSIAALTDGGRGPVKGRVQPGFPLCSMPAPGPVLIQHIMSKLLLVAAPIETLIKPIRGSSWGGA